MNTDLMFSSKTNQWETPQDFFDKLNLEFRFTLDPCADEDNHKCEKYYTKEIDGLSQCWDGERVFCNPPYGRGIGAWVRKCYLHGKVGNGIAVMLMPARTDTKWFHEYIYNKKNVEVRFLKGRLKFGESKNSAPFPSMIVIFGEGVRDKTENDFIRRQDVAEFMFENRYCTSINNAYDQLKNIPAAYDIKGVIEQLEILLEKETNLICRHVSDASYLAAVIGHTMLVDAIEIVRCGGIKKPYTYILGQYEVTSHL